MRAYPSLTDTTAPSAPTLEHYVDLFTRLNLARNFANSLLITVGVTLFSLVVNSMAGYAFAKLRFRGSRVLLVFVIATTAVPTQLAVVPLFIAMSDQTPVPGLIFRSPLLWTGLALVMSE